MKDPIAPVTGCYRGLGLETARLLLKRGFGVIHGAEAASVSFPDFFAILRELAN